MYGFSYRIKEFFFAIGGFFSRIGRMCSFVDGWYSDVGNKICALAKICGILGIVVGVVGAILCIVLALITGGGEFIALAPAVAVSGIAAVISSWPLYAFGQLVQDIHTIRYK